MASFIRFGRGFYPGTGHPRDVGDDAGEGTSVNVAWERGEGYSDAEYLAAFDRLIMPIAREYAPELVIVSAGFDAARGDPLGGMGPAPRYGLDECSRHLPMINSVITAPRYGLDECPSSGDSKLLHSLPPSSL
jgi:acetoin utilization deacetylase AcuC-like enzyme